MSRNKNFVWHTVAFNAEDELNFKNSHMKLIEIFRFAMKRNPEPLFKTTAQPSLYLSNATNQPEANNKPDQTESAESDTAEPTEPDHPAAMVRPDLLSMAADLVPGAAVADGPEIRILGRPDPVPASTILIVRKGTHDHHDMNRISLGPDPVSMAILKKGMMKSSAAFVQIERE